MRQIVLDTETTGLNPAQGHRIIEIGCVELLNRRLSKQHYHRYINPEREIDEGAFEVHGISEAFLRDKPRFAEIAEEFMAFIQDAELIIHNAPFDIGFLNHELNLLGSGWPRIEEICKVVDSLELARKKHPGQKNNLDALCKRYSVDNSQRDLHGALLDSEILADVYLAMTGGQASLNLAAEATQATDSPSTEEESLVLQPTGLKVIYASPEELLAHDQSLQRILQQSQKCLWLEAEKPPA